MGVLKIKNSDGTYSSINAIKGKSAYEIAVKNGFNGTEEEWLASFKYDDTSLKNKIENKVNKDNPEMTGSSLSFNRKAGTSAGTNSIALGDGNTASNTNSVAIGKNTAVTGQDSIGLGVSNTVSGQESVAIGNSNTASGKWSVAIGKSCAATNEYSTSFGCWTNNNGIASMVQGNGAAVTQGWGAMSSGILTTAKGLGQHVFGISNIEDPATVSKYSDKSTYLMIVGNGVVGGTRSNAYTLDWSGNGWYAGKLLVGGTSAANANEVAVKNNPIFTGTNFSFARKSGSTVGTDSIALGSNSEAATANSVAIGVNAKAKGANAVAIGYGSNASGKEAIALGASNNASGDLAVALGKGCVANNEYAFATGCWTNSVGVASATFGNGSYSNGWGAMSSGIVTKAYGMAQHVFGSYNIPDDNVCGSGSVVGGQPTNGYNYSAKSKHLMIVGNGSSSALSNAFTLDWDGNGWFQGNVAVNGTPTEGNHVITKGYLDSLKPAPGKYFVNGFVSMTGDGVADFGKYIDFHNTSDDTSDYSTRLYCNGTTGNSVALPTTSGVLLTKEEADTSYAKSSHSHSSVKLLESAASRNNTTTANLTPTGKAGITSYLSSSNMKTGKPNSDGHIAHFSWDNNGNWDAQLFLPDTNNKPMQYRSQGGKAWGTNGNDTWHSIYSTNHKPAPADIGALDLTGGVMSGAITNSLNTGSYLNGNMGAALLNSTNEHGGYTVLAKTNSTNGYFTQATYMGWNLLQYTKKNVVDEGRNEVTFTAVLLDEDGNTIFPGVVQAPAFVGDFYGNATTATTATKATSADSATKLTTARTINGTSFNGSANITTSKWGTARTIKIGNTSKSVDGSGNVTWTLAEIGVTGGTSVQKLRMYTDQNSTFPSGFTMTNTVILAIKDPNSGQHYPVDKLGFMPMDADGNIRIYDMSYGSLNIPSTLDYYIIKQM